MKTKKQMKQQGRIALAAVSLAVGCFLWSGDNLASAQTAPANLSPGLQEVVKLTQAHMGDDVVTAYIKNSGQSYNLSADDILYLNSQGVSQGVISTLLQAKGATVATPTMPMTPNPVPTTPAPPPTYVAPVAASADAYVPPVPVPGSGIDLNYFQNQLAPYGNWVDVPPYGPAWRPNAAMADPGWRPYLNAGHWEYTENGWYWQSDYPFGDIVFHYGRWLRDFRYGWVWVPGYDWAPAWVAWRQADAYAGWAPLPPAAYFEAGVGLTYHGRFGMDLDFGLGYDDFAFVGYDHFWAPDYRVFLAPVGIGVFRTTLVMNNYSFGPDGRFVVEGLGHDRIALLTHHDVRPVKIVIHDEHIVRDREVQRAFVVNRIQEIRSRPANDPLRRAVENREAGVRGEVVLPGRGMPDARMPEPGRGVPDSRMPEPGRGVMDGRTPSDAGTRAGERGSAPSKDSKDTQNGPGR
jgi:hypothetical protein